MIMRHKGLRWIRHVTFRGWRAIRSPSLTARGLAIARELGRSDGKHIFVVGIPRAGTSLVASILATHPDVAAFRDETYYFLKRNYQFLTLSDVRPGSVETLMRMTTNRAALFDALGDQILSLKPGASRLLEKTPGHAMALEDILCGFPHARVVFCVREPRDAYASLQNGVGLPRMSPKRYLRLWNSIVAKEANAGSERVLTVRYEDLVTDPEATVRALCAFLDLKFDETLLAPESHARNAPSYLRRGDHGELAPSSHRSRSVAGARCLAPTPHSSSPRAVRPQWDGLVTGPEIMRVLHLVPGAPFGGAQRLAVDLAAEQRRRGVDARLLLLSNGARSAATAEAADVPATVAGTGLARIAATRRAVRAASADILHLHLPPPWLVPVLPRGRTVMHLHVRPSLTVHARSARRRLDALGERLTLSRANRAIAISAWVELAWRSAHPGLAVPIDVVHNGVVLPPVSPSAGQSAMRPFTVAIACRLADRKGVRGVHRACRGNPRGSARRALSRRR